MSLVEAGQSAPGRPIYAALAGGRFSLGFERCHGCRLRKTIQRHIYQRGVTAGGGGTCGGGKSFPLRPARFIDVHMRIDQARQ